ncbi:ArsC family reductase [Bisgaard Taxon 10/6]|uniref:ArsC family reductase n=1 Tax=Exercitatus varius TaxID=67857 RepID=UPI0018A42261|nr:ArsC family reductase [Exercitatus varius]QOF67008.1 ArsC family reductase [Actinobacillus sp. GY-402]MDG2917688.1 ArsC family reductase [Exercitatus varius]MDG2939887.1 ArsC family reductase [Exercitatus varius]MDG2941722.1 ArsC family reductase [Exercitatus varius]MDG2947532.1 ArsC family reductase [Exercitatus varius]
MMIVYGIKNCDTVKKALKWLTEHGIEHRLHDYRVDGLEPDFLVRAEAQFGWRELVNKRSTSWRNLDENTKKTLKKSTALCVLAEQPTLIKRPIILQDGIALIGFNEQDYTAAFSQIK